MRRLSVSLCIYYVSNIIKIYIYNSIYFEFLSFNFI